MKKHIKQIITSKRVWVTTLLNSAWLLPHLDNMQLLKDKLERLLDGQDWANTASLVFVVIATIGIVGTKLYDDANRE